MALLKNVSDTQAYTAFDHFFLKALRSVSHVVGVARLTQPFWGRWRASEIGDEWLFRFLSSIKSLDDWPAAAIRMAERERAAFEQARPGLSLGETVRGLRRLSYLCNLGQWGILPVGEEKRAVYRQCRDFYAEAESLAFGDRFRRLAVRWNGQDFPANLHVPEASSRPAPLVVIVHGLDDCKEEHLATELALLEAGFAVAGFDGPGQGEAFLLDGNLWTPDFPGIVSAVIDAAASDPCVDAARAGIVGFSIGSMWALLSASKDRRIAAAYDLGAPINTDAFNRVPFLIKSRMCQITGARTEREIADVLARNRLDAPAILSGILASVRIAHGLKDRVVATKDKVWLRDELLHLDSTREVSMMTFADGDHCCTNHVPEIRRDMAAFFRRRLSASSARSAGAAPGG